MRFKDIKKFNVDDLLLDEENYRFKGADNQKACIDKIHAANPGYFKNLMTSVAEDDLGEPLLVYQNKNKNIVLDGNRRLSVLKIFSNPKKFSPNDDVKKHAEELLALHKIDWATIHAQVSDNKQLIFKTVYERHAAGQGKSRIGWSAYGAARFRYDEQLEDGNDWYSIALLLETENQNPEWTDYIDSKDYSHEVFRRIFKAALDQGIISRSIFSDRNQRIKSSADKKLLQDAIHKTVKFLTSMKNKELSLSRHGVYADKDAVDAYLSGFKRSADNARSQPPENNKSTATKTTSAGGAPASGAPTANAEKQQGYGVERSDSVSKGLDALKSKKLIGLYKSLCVVSLQQHPQLLYVGAWSFFESIGTLMGKKEGACFVAYLGSQMDNMGYSKQHKKDFKQTLDEISKKGNANKHSGTYHSTSAYQLRADFVTLEPFVVALLEKLVQEKKKAA